METIGLCAPAYGAHALLPYAQSIFDVLAKEVSKKKKRHTSSVCEYV